jgi:hypothetical protein
MNFLVRVVLKAGILFLVLNVLFALLDPLPLLNRLTLYNLVFPGRVRLPYGENPTESYNVTLTDLSGMLASHELSDGDKPDDEYRVVFLGDSATWGWLLEPDQTLSACINQQQLRTPSGKTLRVYNLGYPVLDVTKDLLILEESLPYQPDLVVWFITLAALYPEEQLFHQIVRAQPEQVRDLIARYDLALNAGELPDAPNFWERTIVGQRRQVADWLRHQVYGIAWAATGIDHRNPRFFEPVRENLDPNTGIPTNDLTQQTWERDDLSLDVLSAGVEMTQTHAVGMLFINEPIYRSQGVNSDLRYNFYYPRWAYDSYRDLMNQIAADEGWQYVDFWDAVPNDRFTDTSLHYTPAATCAFAEQVGAEILKIAP